MFLNGYPYSDFHELNLDFLLKSMDELKKAFKNFTASNSLIFAEPLLHDLTKSYAKNTIVLDPDGNAYISLQIVPEGVQLSNTDYWLMVFDFQGYVERANKNFTNNYFSDIDRAPYALSVGDWVVLDDVLYRVTVAIAIDELFEIGTNLVHFTVEQFLKDFVTSVNTTLNNWYLQMTGTINQYKNDIDASELAYRQQLAQDIADTTASLQAQLNLAISGATVDSEVINARLGADGVTYPTLGDAIRTQITNDESKMAIMNLSAEHTADVWNSISQIEKNGYSLTVHFDNSNLILCYRDKDTNVNKFLSVAVANTNYTLGNTQVLVYNLATNEISIETLAISGSTLVTANSKKIILLVNLYGFLSSPIPSLQAEIDKYNDENPKYVSGLANVGSPMISGVTKSAGNVTSVTFANNIILTYVLYNRRLYKAFTTANQTYTIPAGGALVANIMSGTIYVATGDVTDYKEVILLYNFWGILFSPINGMQEELRSFFYDYEEARTIITITPNNTYCQIRSAINAITDASESKRYTLFIKNGTYQEIDILTKDYIDLVGESRDGVILNCNGLSSETSPADYSVANYRSQTVSTIPKNQKHLMIHMSNSTVKNMTLKSNAVKYVIHQDGYNQKYTAIVDNCVLYRDDDFTYDITDYDQSLQHIVGVGARGGQFQIYKDCVFIKTLSNYNYNVDTNARSKSALLWHNWNNQSEPCGATLENCSVIGCNIASIYELGSDQNDIININNVKADQRFFGIFYNVTPGFYLIEGEPVPKEDIPYCIKLNINGCDPDFVLLTDGRYDGYESVANSFTEAIFETDSIIKQGQPVTIPDFINNKSDIATSGEFAFALENVNDGFFYASTGNIGNGLMTAGTYTFRTPVYIHNGYFTTAVHGQIVGYIWCDTKLAEEGLVPIIKA